MYFPDYPLVAATHPDPYPYYAYLLSHKPVYYEEAQRLWVVASASAVSTVLDHPLCRVRPLSEPVPRQLLDSPIAFVFQHLVRMNDGVRHDPMKRAVSTALHMLDHSTLLQTTQRWASQLLQIHQGENFTRFAFDVPVYVFANLLGVPDEQLSQTAEWVDAFVRCLAPQSSSEHIEQGKIAAGHLCVLFHTLLRDSLSCTLLTALAEQATINGCEAQDVVVANAIGFLSQTYEATAGLIANTFRILAFHHDLREQVSADPVLLRSVIAEVLRFDPPIQNTRRFLAEDCTISGQDMHAGDTILVLLAAANRDPLFNQDPNRFDHLRQHRRMFTFGLGAHLCPGETLASLIAWVVLRTLLASSVDFTQLSSTVAYRPSANARVALLKFR